MVTHWYISHCYLHIPVRLVVNIFILLYTQVFCLNTFSEWHTHLRLTKISSHLHCKCTACTTHQLKGCGIGFSKTLESILRMQFAGVTRPGFIIQIIWFIDMLFKTGWAFFSTLTNLKDNCSTGCGQKYFKSNSINWNNHTICPQADKSNMPGSKLRHAFTVPAKPAKDCRIIVDQAMIDALWEQIPVSQEDSYAELMNPLRLLQRMHIMTFSARKSGPVRFFGPKK